MQRNPIDLVTTVLAIVGALNWGLVGLFKFDLVAKIFGNMSMVSRIVYSVVGLSGIWLVSVMARAGQTRGGRA